MDEVKKILKDLVSGQQALNDQMLTVVNEQKYLKDHMIAVINGQHAMRAELRGEFNTRFAESDKKTEAGFVEVNKQLDEVNQRLDKQGKQLAYLEDDVPTREEFDNIEKRVEKLATVLKAAAC